MKRILMVLVVLLVATMAFAGGEGEGEGAGTSPEEVTGEFDRRRYEGETIKLLLNQHPYTDGMLAEVASFEAMTGITVEYDIFPEEEYFNRVTVCVVVRIFRVRRIHDRSVHGVAVHAAGLDGRPDALHQKSVSDQRRLRL